jgi:hypothetical protein
MTKGDTSKIYILKEKCPCCNVGVLELLICDNCQQLIAMCDLVFTVFPDPLDININKTFQDDGREMVCVKCKKPKTLRVANKDEIISIGLHPDAYQDL